MRKLDVVVVGGGQAGLAAGRLLVEAGTRLAVLDAQKTTGDSWRRRYQGLTLFTPREYSALSGMAIPGDPGGYPDKDEFADYLEAYARQFRIPVRSGCTTTSVERDVSGAFRVTGEGFDPIIADAVVIAAGGFRNPIKPSWAATCTIPQFAVDELGDFERLPSGPLLVVGDGASGRDVAALNVPHRPVLVSTGRSRKLLPERILGRSLWWWLDVTGLVRAPTGSFLGKRMRAVDPFPNRQRDLDDLTSAGIEIRPRAIGAEGRIVRFADGSTLEPAAIIWAIGYKPDWSFIQVDGALDERGGILHHQGVSPVEGLYFAGLPWQRNRASGLVMGASEDAALVVDHLLRRALSTDTV